MKKQRGLLLVLIFFSISVIVLSCGKKKQMGGDAFMGWVENSNNGLKKEKKIADYSYRAFLKPAGYVVYKEIINANTEKIDYEQAQTRIANLEKMYLFNFDVVSADGKTSVLQHNLANQEEFTARVNYFVSHAQQDFKLVQGEDTLPCVLYHFEQTYGLTALNTISLGFEKKTVDEEKEIQLVYNDRLFNAGEIKFSYSKKLLKKIPQLIL